MDAELERGLNQVIDQLQHLREYQLEGGAMLLAKDASEYLANQQIPGKTTFDDIYEYTTTDKPKWIAENLSQPLNETDLPEGYARAASNGNYDMSPLDEDIYHEWLVHPGNEYLEKCSVEFWEPICGSNGVRSRINPDEMTETDVAYNVAVAILTFGFAPNAIWVPLAAFVGMYAARIGLDQLCKLTDSSGQ